MKKTLLLSLLAAALCGCSTTRNIPNHSGLLRATRVDTLYLNTTQYDSVYVNNWYYIDHGKDTIFVLQKDVEYRYRLLRDTLRIVEHDTLPVVREVEVTKVVSRTSAFGRYCIALVVTMALAVVLYLALLVRRRFTL